MSTINDKYMYRSGMSRRDSLKWLSALAATSAAAASASYTGAVFAQPANKGHWPDLKLKPITAKGYGQDPNLIIPPESPWPLTLTAAQVTLVAILSDIIVPREGNVPSATEVEVPAVINEWVSAPYEGQQRDRVTILHALAWIDDEAKLRFNKVFSDLNKTQQLAIMDDIAYQKPTTPDEFQQISKAFARLRNLVMAAFFCSPAGMKDIGYMGNVPIAGDYPGPDKPAKNHLDKILAELGLTEFAYKA